MTGLPGAEPPDMVVASGTPLDALRSEASTAEQRLLQPGGNERCTALFRDELDAAARKALRAHLAVEARMPEVMAGLMVRDLLGSAMIRDDELEWIVPAAYGWGEPGQEGNQLYGIRIRPVEGVDHLYLAVAVKP